MLAQAARADVSGAGGPDGPTDDQLVHRRWDRWVGADILRNVRRYYALFYNTVKPYEQVDLDDEDLVDPDGVYGAAAAAAQADADAEADAAEAALVLGGPDAAEEGSLKDKKSIFRFAHKSASLRASAVAAAVPPSPPAAPPAATAAPGPVAEATLPPTAADDGAVISSSELAATAATAADSAGAAVAPPPAAGPAPPVITEAIGGSAPQVLQTSAASPMYDGRHHPLAATASVPAPSSAGPSRAAVGAAASVRFTRGPSATLGRPGSVRFSKLPHLPRGDAALAEKAVREAAAAEAARGEAEEDPAGAAVAGVLRELYPASFLGL